MKKKEKKRSRVTMILDHLQSGKSITTLESFELYREVNLSSRISVLRKKDHKIVGVHIKPWKLGEPHVAQRYYIDEFLSLEERTKYDLPYADDTGDASGN